MLRNQTGTWMSSNLTSPEWQQAASNPKADPQQVIAAFEREIVRQEDIIYGVALLFEGLSLLLAGNEAVVETHRRQFRNIIRSGKHVTDWARTLMDQARQNPRRSRHLQEFNFLPCHEHPDPKVLVDRALVLVAIYEELFPGRSREQALTQDETLQLMEAAARKGVGAAGLS